MGACSILAADHGDLAVGKPLKSVRILHAESNFEREALRRPLGFKGGYMTEKWQIAALLESESGNQGLGLCSQSVLWSDSRVFASYSEAAGNALMYAMLDEALRRVRGLSFDNPIEFLEEVFPEILEYGRKITGISDLRETFALMALVSLDNAVWLLYAAENKIESFDGLIPQRYRHLLSHKHKQVASVPLISYSVPLEQVKQLVEEGYFFLKIKIGQPGDQQEMLEQDKRRLREIHGAAGSVENPYTKTGRPSYYLDANGRYQRKDTLLRLLDYARKIGAYDQIAVIEEPFPEEYERDVGDIGFLVAADESAHTDESARARIQMGYSALAVKGAAKTLSMSLKILEVAHAHGIPCFCADSAAIPILVDWNKNLAARLAPIPGLSVGLLETNGQQNYARWGELSGYHPYSECSWTVPVKGVFQLGEDFFLKSGGIFTPSEHYMSLFKSGERGT
jgi:L-alanine-DL-glutamate epimerase-like enolase superfamily enzyme